MRVKTVAKVALLDVSRGSENAGDSIITEAVEQKVVRRVEMRVPRVPTHHHPNLGGMRDLWAADKVIAGGSNLLASHMERHRQWFVTPDLVAALRKKVVLCGVGWWQYQAQPCAYSTWLLRQLLDPTALHSVRDRYTADKLENLGYRVANTNCPTMWSLDGQKIEAEKPSAVVVTVTDYNRDADRDERMLESLAQEYDQLRMVPMAPRDIEYIHELKLPSNATVQGHGLLSLDKELSHPVDYVGTRLHGGIRALQKGRRALVISIDNRALEISRDTGLPTLAPSQLSPHAIQSAFANLYPWAPKLESLAIQSWIGEFVDSVVSE